MDKLKSLTGPALARLVTYLVPIGLGFLFAALANMGWGVWNEAAGTWTITLSVEQITGLVVAFVGAPTLAVGALLSGAKTRVGDVPVAERIGEKPLSSPATGARL